MPSTSKAQARLMAAVAHNPAFAKKVGIPVSVGKDFNKADKGKKFKKGGDTMAKFNPFIGKETKGEEGKEKKAVKGKGKGAYAIAEKKFEGEKFAKGGGIEVRGKTKGRMI